ncbi:helix-turn-helix transcriptional regulator [Corallococcus exiguus]|uniref:PadR family transcriptional regulator n=1 Tax=Corallococcus TaxID=83461 RepID=UPI00131569DB|nr:MULTISPECIES: PadR family transcriptional regulator [Corallococcus]NPC70035.1 helix-turn-helix transcriptional regulator [Corallococcus exiguus]
MTAKAAILTVLMSGKSFGLEVIDKVRDRTKGRIVLNEGSVYPALKSMEREGLLRSFDGEPLPERGGRPRRYYELTGEGRRLATEQRQAMADLMLIPASAVSK